MNLTEDASSPLSQGWQSMTAASSSAITQSSFPTRAEQALVKLRRAILIGELKPGQRISVSRLSKIWSISATPIREAMPQLAAQGLIIVESQRGTYVAPISKSELLDIYDLRKIVEAPAIRFAVESCDTEYQHQLSVAWSAFQKSLESAVDDRMILEQAHHDLHSALCHSHGYFWHQRVASLLSMHSMRYRILGAFRDGDENRILGEHFELFQAAHSGKAKTAESRLIAHFDMAVAGIGEFLTLYESQSV